MAEPALERNPSLNYKPRLVLFDRTMLKVGRWNGNVYPAEEIKPLVKYLNSPPQTPEARNATSLFVGAVEDHQDSTGTWVGSAKGWYFDEKEQALKCKRLEIVQQATAEALAYQLDSGQAVFGISPRLEVRRAGDVCRDIIVKSWGIVLNPAGGEDLFLSKDAPLDDKDSSRTSMSLFMDITKGQFLKGEQNMTSEELQALVKDLQNEVKELKGDGATKPETDDKKLDIQSIVTNAVKTALEEKAKADAEALKKAEEEKALKKVEAVEAHLKGEKHDKTICPLCIAKLAEEEDEEAKKEEMQEEDEEKKEEEAKKKEEMQEEDEEKKEDEEEMKGDYPYPEKNSKLGMVPFLPRKFKVASLEAKSLSRFGEDLVEVIKPLFEKETLTADELQTVVSNLDKLLLQVPHDGPDPKVVKEYEAKRLAQEKEIKERAEKLASEIAKKEIQKLSKTPGRKGAIPEFVRTEEPKQQEFVNPSDKLGSILNRSLTS